MSTLPLFGSPNLVGSGVPEYAIREPNFNVECQCPTAT